jgi:hypothetical protein
VTLPFSLSTNVGTGSLLGKWSYRCRTAAPNWGAARAAVSKFLISLCYSRILLIYIFGLDALCRCAKDQRFPVHKLIARF